MIRLGLIGCGQWGWRYISAASEAGNAEVTHVSRVSERHRYDDTVTSLLAGVKVVGNWRDMLNEPIDAFIVATPPDTHAEICAHLLDLGRPVMVEKPLALSIPHALTIEDLSRSSGAPFLINNLHLFSPAYVTLRDIFLDARPSRCKIYARGGGAGPYRSYAPIWDYGPHDLSMILNLGLGHPTFVDSFQMSDERDPISDARGGRRFDVDVVFGKSKAYIQVWNGGSPKTRWFEVISNGLRLVYDDVGPHKLLRNNRPINVPDAKPLTLSVRAFADAVRTGETDWRFGAGVGVVTTRILHTAETGIVHA